MKNQPGTMKNHNHHWIWVSWAKWSFFVTDRQLLLYINLYYWYPLVLHLLLLLWLREKAGHVYSCVRLGSPGPQSQTWKQDFQFLKWFRRILIIHCLKIGCRKDWYLKVSSNLLDWKLFPALLPNSPAFTFLTNLTIEYSGTKPLKVNFLVYQNISFEFGKKQIYL